MFVIPLWLSLTVGGMVIAFGTFRIILAFRKPEVQAKAEERGGLFGYRRHTNILFGVVYILMGLLLVLPALGVRIPLPWKN
jgi:hypothetical protein